MALDKNHKKDLTGVKEIARRAGVSIATVDRVIHNRMGVSPKTKEKIAKIIEELDYQPNILARRLASKKPVHLGVLIPRPTEETAFWEAPYRGIQRADAEIRPYGVKISAFFFDLDNKKSFQEQAAKILASDIDGILLAPSFIEESIELTRTCQSLKIPFVFIDSNIPEQDSLSYIGPPLFQSGYLGGHIIRYGLREKGAILVLTIATQANNYNYLQIAQGFRQYFINNPVQNSIIEVEVSKTDYSYMAAQLDITFSNYEIEAIFVTNSQVAKVARYLEATDNNSILLIGFDYLPQSIEYLKTGTVDFLIGHKPEEQGYRGIMALYQTLVMEGSVEKTVLMPIDIITRENHEFYTS